MRFGYAEGSPDARLFLDSKSGKRIADVRTLYGAQEIFSAQMQRLVGKLNLARTAVLGRVRRVALRTLCDFAMRGGGGSGP